MKTYKFKISKDLLAYYNAEISIKANNEKQARNKLKEMSEEELSEIATNWEKMTDNASPIGEITIQELIEEDE